MAEPRSREIEIKITGGEWTGGNPGTPREGFATRLRNVRLNAGVWEARPQFTYDNLASIRSLAHWEDDDSKMTRLVAVDASGNLYAKATDSETWGSAASGAVWGARVTATASYRGTLYGLCSNTLGVPTAAFSYDGSAVDTSPFNSTIYARTFTIFKDRAFLAYPRVTVTPANSDVYDWTAWTKTNATISNIVSGGTTVCRVFPTSTAAECSVMSPAIVTVAASNDEVPYVLLHGIRAVDATNTVPLTLETHISSTMVSAGAAVTVGQMYTSGGYIYRVTTAGTTAGAAPSWTTTVGGTNTWGTATFTNEGTTKIAAYETDLLSRTDATLPIWNGVELAVPARTNSVSLAYKLRFANTETTLLSALSPIDVSMKDGATDGDPNKKNFGLQITAGDYYYPFYNADDSASATVDLDEIVWSEVGDPKRIRAQNTYNMTGTAGYPTAAIVAGGRLIVFKRRAMMMFAAVDDPDIVILPESDERVGVGCLGPKALDIFEDDVYLIAENEIYRWRPGKDPEPLCGDAMRDEIMNKSSASWVESQSAPANVPLLRIDHKQREMWVYTQKGRIFVYNIDQRAWSEYEVGGDADNTSGHQVCDMAYNPTTGCMYVAFTTATTGTAGLSRADATQAGANDQISAGDGLPVFKDIILRPIEFAGREDFCLEEMKVQHAATATQTGQTLVAYQSFDQGATFEVFSSESLAPSTTGSYETLVLPYFVTSDSMTPRLVHSGNGGAESFNVSHFRVVVEVMSAHGGYRWQ